MNATSYKSITAESNTHLNITKLNLKYMNGTEFETIELLASAFKWSGTKMISNNSYTRRS